MQQTAKIIYYCKYIIFAKSLPLFTLVLQNTDPALSLPLLFSFGCITIISNNCQIIKGAAAVMDKKSVTTLTLKQINKHTVYQYIYRQRERDLLIYV